MSKIGVGVGEDFPVDDGPERGETRGRPAADAAGERDWDAEYAARHEAHRRWHEQRREWKRQWKGTVACPASRFHEANAGGGAYAGGRSQLLRLSPRAADQLAADRAAAGAVRDQSRWSALPSRISTRCWASSSSRR